MTTLTPEAAARITDKVFSTGDRISLPVLLFIAGMAVAAFFKVVLP